jgi:hypothetical protein
MTADAADKSGLSGQDVVFRLDRGYRRPQRNRGTAFLVLGVIAAVVAVMVGLRVAADVAWGFAVAFGACALAYAVRYVLIGRFRTRLSAGARSAGARSAGARSAGATPGRRRRTPG